MTDVWVVQTRGGGAPLCAFSTSTALAVWLDKIPGPQQFQVFQLGLDPAEGLAGQLIEQDPDVVVRDYKKKK